MWQNGAVASCLNPTPMGQCSCTYPARHNQALNRPVQRFPTIIDILSKPTSAQYLTLIDTTSVYHNLKLNKKCSCLSICACQFGRYRHARLAFSAPTAGNMFQQKVNAIFKDIPNIFGVVDDFLIVGFDKNGHIYDVM